MEKDKLKKLNQLVARLAGEPGNEWMAEDLLKQISLRSEIPAEGAHPILHQIHEQCIEEVIRGQAEEFYKEFPLIEIKDQLVLDFVKMEHERRRNDFESFCNCIYQQIEGIINYLIEKLYTAEVLGKNLSESFYGENSKFRNTRVIDEVLNIYYSGAYKYSDEYLSNFFDSQNRIKLNDHSYRWTFYNRFKAVIYVFAFNAQNVDFGIYQDLFGIVKKLYAVRNKTHRGGSRSDKQQADYEDVAKNSSRSYFMFYGCLLNFVSLLHFTEEFLKRNAPKAQIHLNQKSSPKTYPSGSSPKIVDQIPPDVLMRRMKK